MAETNGIPKPVEEFDVGKWLTNTVKNNPSFW